jgi:hypothetical protein
LSIVVFPLPSPSFLLLLLSPPFPRSLFLLSPSFSFVLSLLLLPSPLYFSFLPLKYQNGKIEDKKSTLLMGANLR